MRYIPKQITDLKVCWHWRISPRADKTTDKDGYILSCFNFTDGQSIEVMAIRLANFDSSCWQKVLFSSPCFLTEVMCFQDKAGVVYIYAEPGAVIKARLV